MVEKFRNKYRIKSTRAPFWDYGWNAIYFVTICVQDRKCVFGDVQDGKMHLNGLGNMANDCWLDIPNHFPFVILGNHIVMPNHVHGIVIIDKRVDDLDFENEISPHKENHCSSPKNRFGPQSMNLGSIVRGFKIGVTKYARNKGIDFDWQKRFHDHIVRNRQSFVNISNYIRTNPASWSSDKFHKP